MRIVARSNPLSQSFWRWPLLMLMVLPLTACSAFPVHSPQVQLESIHPQTVGLVSQTFDLDLKISNPNSSALSAKAGEARLYVQNRQVAYGLLSKPVHIPAYGSSIVSVPVTGNLLPLLGDLGSVDSQQGLPYAVKGYLVTGMFNSRVPFNVTGALHLPLTSRSSAVAP
ncbi:LEA type 2 family protein [Acidithiobacillus montserratensis]|uniref:LEA type 2 family protein n=1 Tax=Acidithiobacillus montserratensis TaxID=2729135 RepID=A0ACD5HF48_9PROT|nr:LEA type 2 family protein [Acidithiobacillus montserratensis]MBN2679726.1 LEA type 2 family protein [Acidithiobacillaceae bacterium]MBU2747934.1 LEA type 2 family protein [Acidithiobacillus montserratensis]